MGSPDGDATRLSLLQALVNAEDREESWRLFLRRYKPLIQRWCFDWNLQDASFEDVSEEVIVKLLKALRTYESGRPFRPWLREVVKNAVLDHLRRRDRRPGAKGVGGSAAHERLNEIEDAAVSELSASLEQRFEGDLRHEAAEAVHRIAPPQTWEAFERIACRDEPVAEVADALGITVRAVYQRVYRIRKQIQQKYDELLSSLSTDEAKP